MCGRYHGVGAYQLRVLSEGMGEGTQGYYSGGLNEMEAREA